MSHEPSFSIAIPPEDKKGSLSWQLRLLPLMKRMLILLALFFFIASFGQLIYLQTSINTSSAVDLHQPLAILQNPDTTAIEKRQNSARLEALILLEANTVERRHHQANVSLMSSIWVRYLGFVTGMILALIGAVFILGKLENETPTDLGGKFKELEANLKTASPGIILVVLGSTLMILTIVMQHTVQVNDAAVYLDGVGIASSEFSEHRKPVIVMPEKSDTTRPVISPINIDTITTPDKK